MRKIEPEIITGMGYIGDNPGVLYRMGGAGEQTVVTGNPALLEGVKGSRFTSLTLHGKSTQVRTTGAQLNDGNISNLIGSIEGVIISSDKYASIIIPIQGGEDYTISYTTHKAITFHCTTEEYPAEGVVIVDVYSGSSGVEVPKKIMHTSSRAKYLVVNVDVNDSELLKNAMLNSGSTALPFEPYTGGAPSPSPSYPQEIESAGQSGEIGVTVYGGNLLLCEEEEAVTLLKEYKFKNPLPVGEYRVSIKSANREPVDDLFLYAMNYADGNSFYGKVSFKTKNTIMRPTNAAVSFAIYSDTNYPESDGKTTIFTGLMLNAGSSVVPYEPYKPAQTLIIPTPGALPGIPVSSGGNYTDEKGQQWVADEIDLARGERVQWVYHRHYASDELLYRDNMNFNIYTYKSEDVNIIDDTKHILVNVGRYNPAFAQNNNYRGVTGGLRGRVDDIKSENDIKNVFPNGIDVWFIRKTPIRTPLPPETIAAYKKLHTYSPTTTVINDGAGMSVGYKRK